VRGVASACASVTVVNAMATGKGAAFGVELRLKAVVELDSSTRRIKGEVVGCRESPKLVEICVRKVLEKYQHHYGARVRTYSEIPVAVGLSSSSAAANAAVLATFASLGIKPKWREVLELGIEASFEAGVTLTGAFDDAAASLLGCGVVTDNLKRRILKKFSLDPSYRVIIFVPPTKLYTSKVNPSSFKSIKDIVEVAHRQAILGNIFGAMVLNGLAYSYALNHDPTIALEAISKGALAAGLTGKGPAVAAIAYPEDVKKIENIWSRRRGKIIVTSPSKEGAKIE